MNETTEISSEMRERKENNTQSEREANRVNLKQEIQKEVV